MGIECADVAVSATAPTDVLSAPSVDDLAPQVLALLPRGAAWRSPDAVALTSDGSRLVGFWRALTAPLTDLYARFAGVAAEGTAITLEASLADWELELGLPDPCVRQPEGFLARKRAVRAKILAAGLITPADFVCLARALGYDAAVAEMQPFRVGRSRCGDDRLWGAEVQWCFVVQIEPLGDPVRFRVGTGMSRVGRDRLLDWPRAEDLECLIRARAPAETLPIFVYAPLGDEPRITLDGEDRLDVGGGSRVTSGLL
jgi:uncharacterized protein YmfQ (DUF2313 family)